jgi:hypothetical protein
MKVVLLALVTVLPAISMLSAQQWTEEEQELLDNIKGCWDSWVEAVQKQSFDIHLKKCAMADNYSMWWTNEGAPTGPEGDRRNLALFHSLDEKWIDIRPAAIRIHDNVAIVQFYGYWQPTVDGKPVMSEYKRTEVFVKKDGRWTSIGGQGTPVSAADSDPYE